MKIVSKRGKKPAVEVTEIYGGLIILNSGTATPEEMRRAEEAIRELRKHLEELGNILNSDDWHNLP